MYGHSNVCTSVTASLPMYIINCIILHQVSAVSDVPQSESEMVARLQHQNENLREVVTQMRQQMERLGEEMPPGEGGKRRKESVAQGTEIHTLTKLKIY